MERRAIPITRLTMRIGGKSGARFGLRTVADVVPVSLFVRLPTFRLVATHRSLHQEAVRPTGSTASFQAGNERAVMADTLRRDMSSCHARYTKPEHRVATCERHF